MSTIGWLTVENRALTGWKNWGDFASAAVTPIPLPCTSCSRLCCGPFSNTLDVWTKLHHVRACAAGASKARRYYKFWSTSDNLEPNHNLERTVIARVPLHIFGTFYLITSVFRLFSIFRGKLTLQPWFVQEGYRRQINIREGIKTKRIISPLELAKIIRIG